MTDARRRARGRKRIGITKLGWIRPDGQIEWNPMNWPLEFIERSIVMLKSARPLL